MNSYSKKFRLILPVLILLSTLCINAQEDYHPRINLGMNGGVNFSKVNFSPTVKHKQERGYQGGISFTYMSEPALGIQIELNYSQRGWKEVETNGYNYTRELNYIELPFLTHAEIGKNKTNILIHFGPKVSYLHTGNEQIQINETKPVYYRKDIDNTYEYALCFGLGVNHRSSIGVFQVEARINHGLTGIFSNSEEDIFSMSQNQTLGITFSYMLPLKTHKENQ